MNRNSFMVYNSIDAMVRHLDTISGRSESNATYDPEWYGSATYDEAKARILKGDDELAKKLKGTERLDIQMPSTGIKKRIVTRVAGFAPHVPNFLAGVPNNMLWVEERKISKKVLTVVYGCNTRYEASVGQIAKVSARVVSAIMSLERKGYRVQLYASNVAESGSSKCGFVVKLKDAGQHIDVLKLAFPLLSASWNRRFGFRYREMCEWHGMGSSLNGYDLRRYLDDKKFKYDVALSYYDAKDIKNVEQLEKMFVENAKKINK